MPERGFDTAFWGDPFIQDLEAPAKLLYIYFWTNEHCNQAGLYEISLSTISFETAIHKDELSQYINSLRPKVVWYPEEKLVWVINFIKRQSKSSKFLAAAAKCLVAINHKSIVNELLKYNLDRYGISIPYQYYMDNLSILTRASGLFCSVSNASSGKGKGKEGPGEKPIGEQSQDSIPGGNVPRTEESSKSAVGSAVFPRSAVSSQASAVSSETGNVSAVSPSAELISYYEKNYAAPMTPNLADEIRDICRNCPPEWVPMAIKEFRKSNGRSFKYLLRIIENWKEKGVPSSSSVPSLASGKGDDVGINRGNNTQDSAARLRASLGKPLG